MADPVVDIQFVPGTVITSAWLNGVNDFVNAGGVQATTRYTSSIANLRLLTDATITQVIAAGYYTTGDMPVSVYNYDPTDTTSTDNGGTIIVGGDGRRWKMQNNGVVSLRQFGAKGDGVTDDYNAINNALLALNNKTLLVDLGTFICGSIINLPSGINTSMVGVSRSGSVLKLGNSVVLNGPGWISYNSAFGTSISNLTLDHNNRPCTIGSEGTLTFITSQRFTVNHIDIVHFIGSGISCNGCHGYDISYNYIQLDTAVGTFNEAILLGSSAGQSTDANVVFNNCINSGMNCSVTRANISDNTISNWKFGGGITTEQDSANSNYYTICRNKIFGGSGTDVNATSPIGIENWGSYSVIADNTLFGNAGSGIDQGGQHCVVHGNICFNNGQVAGSGITTRYANGTFNGSYSNYTGNIAFDTQTPHTQKYGYEEQGGGIQRTTVIANDFNGSNLLGSESINAAFVNHDGPSITNTQTINPGTINNNTTNSYALTVAGAVFGDTIITSFSQDLTSGIVLSGYVTAANTVVVTMTNNTGAPRVVASGQVRVKVVKPLNYTQY